MFSLWAPGPRAALSLRRSRSSAESTLSSSGMEEILKEMCSFLRSSAMGLAPRGSERWWKKDNKLQEFSVDYAKIVYIYTQQDTSQICHVPDLFCTQFKRRKMAKLSAKISK